MTWHDPSIRDHLSRELRQSVFNRLLDAPNVASGVGLQEQIAVLGSLKKFQEALLDDFRMQRDLAGLLVFHGPCFRRDDDEGDVTFLPNVLPPKLNNFAYPRPAVSTKQRNPTLLGQRSAAPRHVSALASLEPAGSHHP